MVSLPDSFSDLSRRHRLVAYYAVGLVAMVLFLTVVYFYGMRTLEGEGPEYTVFNALTTVVETMTTTGYGADSPWSHPLMNLYVVFVQLSGIAVGFFTLRLVIIPLFTGAEVDLDSRLSPKRDHVIICEYSRDSAVLLDELRELDVDYVLISSDEAEAKALADDGYAVIHGSPQDAEAFERASIDTARAVITDADDANVNTILTIRSVREDVDVIALTDDSEMERVLHSVGADTVLSPHGVLGRRLADKAVESFTAEVRETVELGGDIEIAEVPVSHGSPLVGSRIRESAVRERTGANIIGAWIDGELQLPPDPDAVIRDNTVLLVSGRPESFETLSEFTRPARTVGQHDRIVIAGFGEVGQAAATVVAAAGIETTTVDITEREGVDVVGDVSTRDTLREAGVDDADAIVIGLPEDSQSLLTAVLAQEMNPDIEVLIRVTDAEATRKALSAGADYVLSVPRVSARMIAKALRGEAILDPGGQIRLIRVPATPFAGSTIAESGIAETTGCRVVAVTDEAGKTTVVDPQRALSAGDELTLVGSDESVRQFLKRYDVTPAENGELS
ncbi:MULTISPECIES: potassium channel family protein [Halolamina]|uniref:Trk K+ transport system, NAD-binding component n=1 Tax=Halolamina pelagica TaxID=699431 RepID=A0A1I5VIY7_9EURY|nr:MULTISPECIES: NAD-binding protein [Halolamina]NHX37666.1 TrkA family potassium uptake protein [Halolamina sp. R1-12]SFQ06956.1 Trk K+ transport system, NAD-binding component [Halolamina pelagica]